MDSSQMPGVLGKGQEEPNDPCWRAVWNDESGASAIDVKMPKQVS